MHACFEGKGAKAKKKSETKIRCKNSAIANCIKTLIIYQNSFQYPPTVWGSKNINASLVIIEPLISKAFIFRGNGKTIW
jgi:hypothetical protein